MIVNEIKDINEFKKIINDDKKTLVDFYSDWCGPCKMISPIINKLANIYKNINFIKVNIDILQDIAFNYKILSVPTLIMFKNGIKLKCKIGFATANEIIKDLID